MKGALITYERPFLLSVSHNEPREKGVLNPGRVPGEREPHQALPAWLKLVPPN